MEDIEINRDFLEDLYQRLSEWALHVLPNLFLIVIFFLIALTVVRFLLRKMEDGILRRITNKKIGDREAEKRATTLINITKGVIIISLWTVFLLVFLQQLGLEIGPILAGAGIVGLAVGFGAQELVRDVISGFFILLENQIRTGDVAIINGTSGLVERIELRTVTLRDLSGVVHVFQNGKINTLSNMTKEWSAIVFDIGVAYKEKTEQVINIIKEIGAELQSDPDYKEKILQEIEVFGVDSFAESAVVIKTRFKTLPGEQWSVGREFRKRLKKAFDQKGVSIPFPHRTLYWGQDNPPVSPGQNHELKED